VDALAALLDGPRARGAFLLRAVMTPPWSLRVVDEAPLTIMAVAEGEAWITPDGGTPIRLGSGDIAVARGPDSYSVADDPLSPTDVVIHPGQRCCSVDGEPLAEAMALGVRTWGNDPDGSTVLLVGTYETIGEISDQLLRALPPLLTLASDAWDCPLIPLLRDELARDAPSQGAVLDRLLDLVLIAVLRTWFASPGVEAPPWYQAQDDPVVGHVLRIMHNRPDVRWTVATLAEQVGVSRASLARRFHDLVGEPPMTFLTDWRVTLAADLLCAPDATVTSVARQVGYGSPFAFSTAFKRVRGMSPKEHRALAVTGAR
jgi:AraC-like DNA-binding protein